MIKETSMHDKFSITVNQLRNLVDAYCERRFDPRISIETACEIDMIIGDLEQIIKTAEKKSN